MRGSVMVWLWLTVAAGAVAMAQAKSQWDGIFTEEQATRGATLYGEQCESCHLDTLEGAMSSPPLIGEQFNANWDAYQLSELFKQVNEYMPQGEPGSLTPEQTVDVLTFIFQQGGAPAGSTELAPDLSVLEGMRYRAVRPES